MLAYHIIGGYDDTPEHMARDNEKFFENGWLANDEAKT
jgi:hypothetical protein